MGKYEEMKLAIYEKEYTGQITVDQRDDLLFKLESVCEEVQEEATPVVESKVEVETKDTNKIVDFLNKLKKEYPDLEDEIDELEDKFEDIESEKEDKSDDKEDEDSDKEVSEAAIELFSRIQKLKSSNYEF